MTNAAFLSQDRLCSGRTRPSQFFRCSGVSTTGGSSAIFMDDTVLGMEARLNNDTHINSCCMVSLAPVKSCYETCLNPVLTTKALNPKP